MIDEFELLRQARPAVAEWDRDEMAAGRAELKAHIAHTQPGTATATWRLRRRWIAPLGAVIVLATAAAGWRAVVAHQDPRTSLTIACGADSVLPASTGDPVADCAARWPIDHHQPAPPLKGYITSTGAVLVIPADVAPPPGSTPIPPGFTTSRAVILLDAELGDRSRGLMSKCFQPAEAAALVADQSRSVGLAAWAVKFRKAVSGPIILSSGKKTSPPKPPWLCTGYYAVIQPDHHHIELIPQDLTPLPGSTPAPDPGRSLAEWLSAHLVSGPEARCLSVDQAVTLARQEAATLGLIGGEVQIHTIAAADPTIATCARPTTDQGGSIFLTIRAAPPSPR